jgi:hypothetical protein
MIYHNPAFPIDFHFPGAYTIIVTHPVTNWHRRSFLKKGMKKGSFELAILTD